MHSNITNRWGNSPLEKIMVDIKDCSMDIVNIASWLGDLEWGDVNISQSQLKTCSDKLEDAYNKLRALTGAHPCK